MQEVTTLSYAEQIAVQALLAPKTVVPMTRPANNRHAKKTMERVVLLDIGIGLKAMVGFL